MQAVTRYGDETVVGAENILLTFTKIGHDVLPTAVEAVLDMSTALGQDLKSSALAVGKSLNNPIRGVTALQRVGVSFTEAERVMIKALADAGDVAGAQTVILGELQTEFGGSARAARETLGGALAALRNSFGDLFETGTSGSEDLRRAIERVVAVLSDPATIAAVQNFGGALFSGFAQAIEGAREFAAALDALGRADFATFMELTAFPSNVEGLSANFAAKLRTGLVQMRADIAETAAFYDAFGDTFERVSRQAVSGIDDVAAAAERAKGAIRQGLAGEVVDMSDLLAGRFTDAHGAASAAAKAHAKALTDAASAQKKAGGDTIAALEFEQDQLGRTAREQAIYNEVKRAGVEITSEYGRQSAEEAGKLYDLRKAQEEARASTKIFGDALNGVFTGAIKDTDQLIDSITSGFAKIAAEKAVDNLTQAFGSLGGSITIAGQALKSFMGGLGIG